VFFDFFGNVVLLTQTIKGRAEAGEGCVEPFI
jgi:hypothetical protein